MSEIERTLTLRLDAALLARLEARVAAGEHPSLAALVAALLAEAEAVDEHRLLTIDDDDATVRAEIARRRAKPAATWRTAEQVRARLDEATERLRHADG